MNQVPVGYLISVGVMGIIRYGIVIFFIVAIVRTLNAIPAENRRLLQGVVWAIILPYVGPLCMALVGRGMAQSLDLELTRRDVPHNTGHLNNAGLAYAAAGVLSIMAEMINSDWRFIFALGMLAVMIYFWIQMAKYKTILDQTATQ